jgi:acyl-CoA thioester hydrolase
MQIMTRRVHVYETDVMGIVHHSNYVRYCEEARVLFCDRFDLLDLKKTSSGSEKKDISVHGLTVIAVHVEYKRPLRFHDEFFVEIQGKQDGIKLILQYRIFKIENDQKVVCCLAQTDHCSLDENLKVKRPTPDYLKKTKELAWTETWL